MPLRSLLILMHTRARVRVSISASATPASFLVGCHTTVPSQSWDRLSETLHGKGSLKDPLKRYFLKCPHVVNYYQLSNLEDKGSIRLAQPAY
jgi:hypothetical protein